MINHLTLIAFGGAIGAILRYFLTIIIPNNNFPLAILTINIIGSFLIGISFYFLQKIANQELLKYFFTIGLLGSFTTFSTFSLDIFKLIEEKQILISINYIFASIFLSVFAVFLGYYLCKNVF